MDEFIDTVFFNSTFVDNNNFTNNIVIINSDYVDCVRWVGNLIVSKSTASKVESSLAIHRCCRCIKVSSLPFSIYTSPCHPHSPPTHSLPPTHRCLYLAADKKVVPDRPLVSHHVSAAICLLPSVICLLSGV